MIKTVLPICRGIRSWNPSATYTIWRRGKRPTNWNLTVFAKKPYNSHNKSYRY